MLGSEDAQDASQEVWIRVWRNIKTFRGKSAFSTWLHRIAVNTCLSVSQRESRRQDHEVGSEMPYLLEPSGGEADPETSVLNAERREEIEAALRHVRAEHRAALVLRHMEGSLLRGDSRGIGGTGRDCEGLGEEGQGCHARSSGPRADPG